MIGNFFKSLKKHWSALTLAILIGLIVAAPQVYFRWANPENYQGIELNMKGSDELYYLARIQEVRDGHLSLASPFWAEGKDLPYLKPAGSEILAAWFGRFFGLDLKNTILLERFVFPAIIFLLVYFLTHQLSRKRLIALLAASTVLLSTELVSPGVFWNLIIHQQADQSFLPFSHIISPQAHLLFFFGFLLFFWLFLEKEKIIYGIISGLVFGLSFYTYPYTWSFLAAFLGVSAIIFLWRKDWFWLKRIILVFGGGLLIALLFFWNLYQAVQYPTYKAVSLRFGIIKSHWPEIGLLVLVLLAVFLFFFSRQDKKRYFFGLALVLTPLIVLNQQIITGQSMIPAHYHWYFHRPLLIVFLIIIIFERVSRIKDQSLKKYLVSGLAGAIFLVNFYNAFLAQVNSYRVQAPLDLVRQRYAPIFKWLGENAAKDEVVLANPEISSFLPVYTALNPLFNPDAHFSLIADEGQLTEREFLIFRLSGVNRNNALDVFLEKRAKISADLYGQYYRKQSGGYDQIPDVAIYWLAKKYQQSLNAPLEDIFKKYQAKYLIWDSVSDRDWQVDNYDFLGQIYEDGGIKIYQIIYDES